MGCCCLGNVSLSADGECGMYSGVARLGRLKGHACVYMRSTTEEEEQHEKKMSITFCNREDGGCYKAYRARKHFWFDGTTTTTGMDDYR